MTQYKIIGYNFGNVTHETPDHFSYQTIVAYYYVKVGKKTMIWNPNKSTILEGDKEKEELPPGYVKKVIKVKKEKKKNEH